jgi:glycogen operon protein
VHASSGRRPYASVNFITAHDGFSLEDLVSYNDKHNDANHEENRDGHNGNHSWNCGAEGPTADPAVLALRAQQKRNFIATLLLSQGVPMLLAGDELGRTQHGNNNAYAQDNEISWIDWETVQQDLLAFTCRVMELRKTHPAFRRRSFFQGLRVGSSDVKDIMWLNAAGHEMSAAEWEQHGNRCVGVFLSGAGLNEYSDRGELVKDDDFLLLCNANHEAVDFCVPSFNREAVWVMEFDTSRGNGLESGSEHVPGQSYPLAARSLVLLRERRISGK